MRSTIRFRMTVLTLVLVVGSLAGLPPSHAQTQGSEKRQDSRDTKQTGREDARDEKAKCKAGDEKTRAECRQDKRDTKQDTRQDARDIKKQ